MFLKLFGQVDCIFVVVVPMDKANNTRCLNVCGVFLTANTTAFHKHETHSIADISLLISTAANNGLVTVTVQTRDVNEARSGRGQLSCGRGQNCINFFSQILYFDPIFSKKQNFPSIFHGTLQISAQTGFSMGILLVNTPKTTSYAFGRRLLLLCLHIE